MEGLILNEESKCVTYMCPIFDALGDDYIRKSKQENAFYEICK